MNRYNRASAYDPCSQVVLLFSETSVQVEQYTANHKHSDHNPNEVYGVVWHGVTPYLKNIVVIGWSQREANIRLPREDVAKNYDLPANINLQNTRNRHEGKDYV